MCESFHRNRSGFARAAFLAAVFSVLVAAGTGEAGAQEGEPADSQPMIGESAPDFDLKTIAGRSLSLTDLRGSYVVVHFGTSW